MNAYVRERLLCPVCGEKGSVTEDGRSFFCHGKKRHTYDFARSGYLNLARAGQAGTGDSKEAVRARSAFLDADYYLPLAEELCRILKDYDCKSILDAGCGEGYYTDRMARGRDALGVDLSVAGVDRAARRSKQSGTDAAYTVGSLFSLPVADESFDAVTSIFAPCAEEEFLRVLSERGILILVGAGKEHLFGLKELLYDCPYTNPGREDLPSGMQLAEQRSLRYTVTVEGNSAVEALFSMTPYYWRTSREDHAKLASVERLTTAVDFDIFIYRKAQT